MNKQSVGTLFLVAGILAPVLGHAAFGGQPKPTLHSTRKIEGWTVRIDDRLLQAPNEEVGKKALRFLENKLADITVVVPEDRLKKLRSVTIVLDLTHGKLTAMQYHPSAGWLKANGYATDLARCVHLPRAADLPTKRNINEQPWVILHELAHAYHDQVLGFDHPRVREAYVKYKKSGRGDKTLLYNGRRVRHYALTNEKEFFAEMTEAYFGVNDLFPFTRAELRESEPEIYSLLQEIWESPMKSSSLKRATFDSEARGRSLAGRYIPAMRLASFPVRSKSAKAEELLSIVGKAHAAQDPSSLWS